MKVKLVFIGKTSFDYVNEGIKVFEKRLKHYLPLEIITIEVPKKKSSGNKLIQKKNESEIILSTIRNADYLILLDERGDEYNSLQFSAIFQKLMATIQSDLVFVVGGAFGFDDIIYKRANMLLSLSKMTYSHQLIRLIFVEQLYRGMTIIKNEPYHH